MPARPRTPASHISASAGPAPALPVSLSPTPGELQDQLRRLCAGGGTYRSIAAAAGLAPATVHDLATGRRNPTPATIWALRGGSSGTLRHARVDAGGTRLRLRALHVMGHGSARIGRALGVRETAIRQLVRGDTPTVSAALRDAVTDLYDAWWDKRAPERTGEPSGPLPPPPAAAPSPATGAPAPAWTTTFSTPPATSPKATGNPPPAPAPPPTSTRRAALDPDVTPAPELTQILPSTIRAPDHQLAL
jgi:hypothetical protein